MNNSDLLLTLHRKGIDHSSSLQHKLLIFRNMVKYRIRNLISCYSIIVQISLFFFEKANFLTKFGMIV